MKQKKAILLVGILIIFLLTRLFKITEVPASLYWDEASIGYNAYSILKTGKDEWGEYLPLHFKAFGEYKLPLFIYSVSFFQFFLGPSELSVRLPSVVFSMLTILIIYFFILKIYQNFYLALFSSFLLTIIPWFFIFSRTGFEATAGLMFYLLGILLFLYLDKKSFFLLLAIFSFILSMYSYNSFRIVSPLTIIILTFFLMKKVTISTSILVISFLALIIFSLSLIPIVTNMGLYDQNSRFQTVSVISRSSSKPEAFVSITKNYLSHFNPQFLFFKGDGNLRHNVPNFGGLIFLTLPFLLIGFYSCLKKRGNYLIPLCLLLVAPIPSSLAIESPHLLRASAMAPFFVIITSIGIYEFTGFFKNQIRVLSLIGGIFFFLFISYLHSFFNNYSMIHQIHWQYGYQKIFTTWKENFEHFDNIIISNRQSQPYIFALFYLKYDPDKFRKEVIYNKSETSATSLVNGFENFKFTNIEYPKFSKGKSLIFADPSEKLIEIPFKDQILNPDGSVAFYVYEFYKD